MGRMRAAGAAEAAEFILAAEEEEEVEEAVDFVSAEQAKEESLYPSDPRRYNPGECQVSSKRGE